MKDLLILDLVATTLNVPCADGKRIRIAAVQMNVTPGNTGDIVQIQFARELPQALAIVTSNPLESQIVSVTATIGTPPTSALLDKIDPVTGLATYEQSPLAATMALPDLWLPFDITLTISMAVGSITSGTVTYEQIPAEFKSRLTPQSEEGKLRSRRK